MKKTYEALKNKGWEEEEIQRALRILKYGKSNQKNLFFHKIKPEFIYWLALIISIISNMILAVLTIPLLVALKHKFAYIFMALFALGFGVVLNILLQDIEFSDPNHHVVAGIFIPTIALINIYIVVNLTNDFIRISAIPQSTYNTLMISAIYVIAYTLPYFYKQTPIFVDKILKNEND